MRIYERVSSLRRTMPAAFGFGRRVFLAITFAGICLASGFLVAQSPLKPDVNYLGEQSLKVSPKTELTADDSNMKTPEPTPMPDPAELPKTQPISLRLLIGGIVVVLSILLAIIFASRKSSGGQLSGPSPQPDSAPVPDPNLDTLIAIYRSNGDVLPPKDQADLQKRISDLVFGIHAYAVCNHNEVADMLRSVEEFDPPKAFYYLVEYHCPGGIIPEDMKSGAMRTRETRRVFTHEGTTIKQIRYFHYLPENVGLQAFK